MTTSSYWTPAEMMPGQSIRMSGIRGYALLYGECPHCIVFRHYDEDAGIRHDHHAKSCPSYQPYVDCPDDDDE